MRREEDLEGVPTETHHGRISKKTGKQKMEKEGMKGDGIDQYGVVSDGKS